ncbi:ligand-binding sensor domain-containing protein [Tenacibaculum caenipelagi]|uniref:Two component regulator with propeller domain n=1 Tax=Tenacibaculum caenipelagi TaxID=1325435 RepID=A0A4R6TB79_9FLAO|nr:two-component regulator propeller domain-containing protein [Tenacibaculum caenipelagi]TDQ25441.1 two component regulator with propeller domain [Tenacibaculum caenipelagi]
MTKQIFTIIILLTFFNSKAQNLFSEQFDDCHQARFSFCLDCGETKAQSESDINEYFKKHLTDFSPKLRGKVFVQVIVDSIGNQCVKSLQSKTNKSIKKLELKDKINSMSNWKPAICKGKERSATVVLEFLFNNGQVETKYKRFDTKNQSNMKSVGPVEIDRKRKYKNKLDSNSFEVFTTQNSIVPWDMSRAIISEQNGVIWYGTDNGIVKVENGNMTLFGSKNTPIKATPYNKNKLQSIMHSAIDSEGNKWFVGGKSAYKYNDENWQVFDTINSPLRWTTKIYADKIGNVWFPSSKGLIKYDGKNWSVMDTTNSKLPSNRVMGVFLDSKSRLWIGTNKGNIRIDGEKVIEFKDGSPLSTSTLTKGFEDSTGTIWFSLYEKFPQTKGFAKFKTDGTWEIINTDNSDMPRNDVLDFAIDEKNNRIWLSLNRVGISMFDGENWQTFTPENSKVPSTYVQRMTLDNKGNLWCATFAGLLKIKIE